MWEAFSLVFHDCLVGTPQTGQLNLMAHMGQQMYHGKTTQVVDISLRLATCPGVN